MRKMLVAIFGHWQAPTWMHWCRAHPVKTLLSLLSVLLLAAIVWGTHYWYSHLPKPQTFSFDISVDPTDYHQDDKPKVNPMTLSFSGSVAPLDNIGQPITEGIQMSPAIEGQWRWASDRHLQFMPDGDWPIDQTYHITLDKHRLLADKVLLSDYSADFTTAPFIASIQAARLYQDPTHPEIQKLVATVAFSHPVDTESVKSKLSVVLSPGLSYSQGSDMEVTFDDKHLFAYVHSAPLEVPLESSVVTLEVAKGIKGAEGGSSFIEDFRNVNVPSRYQLTFEQAQIHFVDNEQQEPEPVIMMESSRPVSDDALRDKVHAWVLPETNPNGEKSWYNDLVTNDVLSHSQALDITMNPGAEGLNTLHSFKFHADSGRYIAVYVDPHVQGQGGYQSRDGYLSVLYMPDYPKTLAFLGDGALLTLDGNQQLGYLVRGVDTVEVEVAQLLPDQLHQLVDQTSGKFIKPFMDNTAFDRISTRTTFEQHHVIHDPAKSYYGRVSLKDFLQNKRGIFVVSLAPANNSYRPATFSYDNRSDVDMRFIVVTDLGIIAKRNRDGSQDVFVQSLAQGKPVEGAMVSVIGRNGLPVAQARSDADGHVNFADLDELRREKTPLFYQVEKAGDVSFLPIRKWEHRLDLSRFDIGGVEESDDANTLNAYLFTDRGLYRPGETVHLASLVRGQDWLTPLDGLPVKMQIYDTRGLKVMDQTLQLDDSGFDSRDYTVSETAAAGRYIASLTLVQDENHPLRLGDVYFDVRDFEPDRMKVRVDLADNTQQGWLKPEQVAAQVSAEQLFGGAAADRRVTAEMVLSPTDISFKQWQGYHFGLAGELQDTFHENLAETKTDANGQANLELALDRFDQSTYKLHLLTRVYEADAGRNVSAQQEALVSSADYLLGYKADGDLNFINKDSSRTLHLIAIDQSLQTQTAQITVERIARRWASVLIKQNDGSYRYESRRKDQVLDSQELALTTQGLDLALDSSEPGDYRLRIVDQNGQQLNEIDYSIAGKGNATRSLDRDSELVLELDKKEYTAGDDIRIAIQSPYTGAGLITIERDKIYAFKWFKTNTTRSVQHITLPEGLEGNAYINVQFLRAPDSEDVLLSPLSYAVAPFNINLQQRRQSVSLDLPEQLKPGHDLTVKLELAEAAKAVVFGVDAGILQAARYQQPDPLAYFFAKKALTVESSQILDLLLPDLRLLMRHAAPGGDMAADSLLANLNPFKRKRAEPVAYWSGLQQLTAGSHDFHYTVPDSFNGNMQFFAVTVTDHHVGIAKADVNIKAPVVMTPNVPAMLAPGDEADITLGLYNTEAEPVTVDLQLDTSEGLQWVDKTPLSFTIEPGREHSAHFRIKANNTLGAADLRWQLSLGDDVYQMQEQISVRPLTPYRLSLVTDVLDKPEQILNLQRDLFKPLSHVEAGLQNSPLVWTQGLQNYLSDYQHACTEQLVSKTVPILLLDNTQYDRAEFQQLITTLRNRQNSQGAFGLWGANPVVAPMVSLYVVDMLLDAKANDYPVPQDLLDNANNYLSTLSSSGSDGLAQLRERAYAAYLLARQGVQVGGALADIHERLQRYFPDNWQSDMAAAWLAASFTLSQNQTLAAPLWDKQPWQLLEDEPTRQDLYLDPLVHDAQLLTLIARHAPDRLSDLPDELLPAMGHWLSEQRYTSLSAGTLIRALTAYAGKADAGDLTMQVQLNQAWQTLTLPVAELPFASKQIKLSKSGSANAFYMVSEEGFDTTPGDAYHQGLEVSRDYLDLEGNKIDEITVGDEFLVRLRVRTTELNALDQVVLIDLLPGGVEPVYREANSQFDGWQPPIGVAEQSDWSPQSVNVREDRIVLYGTAYHDAGTFVYKARAINAGRFQIPPAYAEGLYDPLQQAQGKTGELIIKAP